MNFDRQQTRYVIPAWEIGDRVEHKASGLAGTVKGFIDQGHMICNVRLDGMSHLDGRRTRYARIHASDLVVHQAGITFRK